METGTPTTTTSAAPATQAPQTPTPAQGGANPGQASTQGQSPGQSKPDAPKTPPAPAKVWEVKINGKVQKVSEQELLSMASMGGAANEKFNEAAKLRKQAEQALGRVKDPKQMIAALQDPALGLTKDQIREAFEEWYAKEYIEPEKLTPEQRKLKEAEERIKRFEDAERERNEANQKSQEESMTAQAREAIQNQIVEAIEQHGLPNNKFTIRRIAHWMRQNHANGFNAPTEILVNQVRGELNQVIRDLVESSDGDVLIKLLGDGVVQKLRRYDLDQLKKSRGQGQTQAPSSSESQSPGRRPQERAKTTSEVTSKIRELQRNGW